MLWNMLLVSLTLSGVDSWYLSSLFIFLFLSVNTTKELQLVVTTKIDYKQIRKNALSETRIQLGYKKKQIKLTHFTDLVQALLLNENNARWRDKGQAASYAHLEVYSFHLTAWSEVCSFIYTTAIFQIL